MAENKSKKTATKTQGVTSDNEYIKLVEKSTIKVPQAADTVIGTVLSASKSEVRLDIDGVLTGVVRARELYQEAEEYANLKPGDDVEATVIEEENENGELELSFRFAGQEKAWAGIREAFTKKGIIRIKITDANKGGLIAHFRQIYGFLPVSQLAPENYPRVDGGDKSKILERLKSFASKEFDVKVITLDERDEKIIFSEKEAWNELQKDIINKYKVGTVVEGDITAITDFGVFISFGENLEGLIHISELAWQRIDDPGDLFHVGEKIKAEVISLDGSKIFLSAKKLMKDPWQEVAKKYKVGQIIKSEILKVNPFGLFVKLDKEIHGLAHISQLGLAPGQRIHDVFKAGTKTEFEIVSIEPKDHRLGLTVIREKKRAIAKTEPAVIPKKLSFPPSDAKALAGKKATEDKDAEVKEETKKVKTEAKKKATSKKTTAIAKTTEKKTKAKVTTKKAAEKDPSTSLRTGKEKKKATKKQEEQEDKKKIKKATRPAAKKKATTTTKKKTADKMK